jgi:hypothetical protein
MRPLCRRPSSPARSLERISRTPDRPILLGSGCDRSAIFCRPYALLASECIPQILTELVQPADPTSIAAFLFVLLQAVHGAQSGITGLRRGRPGGDEILDFHVQVILEFFGI